MPRNVPPLEDFETCKNAAFQIWYNMSFEEKGYFIERNLTNSWFDSLLRHINIPESNINKFLKCFFDYGNTHCIIRKWDHAVLVGSWQMHWSRTYDNRGRPSYRTIEELNQVFIPPHYTNETLEYLSVALPGMIGSSTAFIPLEWVRYPEDEVHSPPLRRLERSPQYSNNHREWETVYTSSINLSEIYGYLALYSYCLVTGFHLNFGREIIRPDLYDNPLISSSSLLIEASENLVHFNLLSEDFPRQSYIIPQERERNMTTQQSQKYLTDILRTIKRKWKNLIENRSAYTWIWLNKALSKYMTNQIKAWKVKENIREGYILTRDQNQKKNAFVKETHTKILNMLQRTTGYPFQTIGFSDSFIHSWKQIYPRCMLKAYWCFSSMDDEATINNYQVIQYWCTTLEWDSLKENDELIWDSVTKDWYHQTCYVRVRTSQTEIKNVLITKVSYKEIERCNSCNSLFLKTLLKKNFDTDQFECQGCREKQNPEPTRQTVYTGYHSHSNWNFKYVRTEKDDPRCICFGLEIEMHSKLGNSSADAQESAWQITRKRKELGLPNIVYFERDGSLMEGGFEMVTSPMSLNYHKFYWTQMLPKIREVAVGWNTHEYLGKIDDQWYGIHLTFSRKYMKDLALARLVKFFDDKENNNFVLGLAQRRVIYSGGILGNIEKPKLKDKVNLAEGKIQGSNARYVPVNVKQKGLVELRFWRTTLNTESFLKNLEWFWLFHKWVESTPYSHKAKDFVTWVLANKQYHGMVPNFIGYYSRNKFPVKKYGMVENYYAKLFQEQQEGQIPLFNLPSVPAKKEEVIEGDVEVCA